MSSIVQTGAARAGLPAVASGQLSLFADTTDNATNPVLKTKNNAGAFRTVKIAEQELQNANSALQSLTVVAGTNVYMTSSNLNLAAIPGILVGTTFRWRAFITKSAVGTGNFSIILFRGVNGTTGDTADVTQNIATAAGTAVVDTLEVDVKITFTAIGASGSYFWSIACSHTAATATGFGLSVATVPFTGTVSSVNTTTASVKYGIGFVQQTGTPVITVPLVAASAENLD